MNGMKECVCCQCSDWPPGDAPEYFQCIDCKLYGTSDDFEYDRESGEVCNECMEIRARESALDAGIPLSVIEGKTKLQDHFSAECIRAMCDPRGEREQGDDE